MSRTSNARQDAIDKMIANGVPASVATIVRHNAARYATIQERWCNEEMSDRATARLEATEQRIEARITDLLAPYGIIPHFSGDPRGFCVKLTLPDGAWNTWGGQECGFGIA
jgi:hypothetical protein